MPRRTQRVRSLTFSSPLWEENDTAFPCPSSLRKVGSPRFWWVIEIEAAAQNDMPVFCFDASVMHLRIKGIGKRNASLYQAFPQGIQTLPGNVLFGEPVAL